MGDATNLHASAVALTRDRGVLILGRSGGGKSALALRLMACGAYLVADDRVDLRLRDGGLWASAPPRIRGLIEARGFGLLSANALPVARIALAVDLDHEETERLPPMRETQYLGQSVPLVRFLRQDHFPAAIMQYLRGGRVV
ncbi:HPr kinase/phosphorylase [Pontitalea aquivivens]|uniref:HPr kinase/phosphorylase n=1 Tax=Pontitalea aquivivens TaxID=3388663 RepID=UPI00397091F5